MKESAEKEASQSGNEQTSSMNELKESPQSP
ncbi:unnamed protein product [Chondrus crispus]|uniref:Uncharacterized protein n=1 Tax=Chondrus crispus TaxID=2769 RepID=R7QS00_CHOCR|nr:unnamed protein product [Chondrus crispus]XP_005712730.1 unnamed protein product [Chondrus crispus]CDF32927.1 unnamed protein product [Chondrus crispus]CDF40904.1 unnamed protein product [Chondrus crispus]|eukprot:XP_005711198.1 unnamed protein product [Chondrus crispus]